MRFLSNPKAPSALRFPGIASWLAKRMSKRKRHRLLDEEGVRAEILSLRSRYALGEISRANCIEQEEVLVERINALRVMMTELGRRR